MTLIDENGQKNLKDISQEFQNTMDYIIANPGKLGNLYSLLGSDLEWIAEYLLCRGIPFDGVKEIANSIGYLRIQNKEALQS